MSRWAVVLESGDERVTLLLVRDPERRRRALAHGYGYALSHAERHLPPKLRGPVLELARAFSAGTTDALDAVAVLKAVALTKRIVLPIRRVVPLPPADHLPRVSGALRVGEPENGKIFPFDAEVAGLFAGVRTLVKRDGLLPAEVMRTRDHFVRKSLHCEEARESDGRIVLFASREPDLVREAVEMEALLAARGPEAERAARFLGRALGYPDCCVEAFSRLSARDDLSLALALLPPPPAKPASPFSTWLAPPLALVSHAPCSLDCAATISLGKTLFEALSTSRAGFAEAWMALARRVVALTSQGDLLLLDAKGDLAAGAVIEDAVELCVSCDDLLRAAPSFTRGTIRMSGASAFLESAVAPLRVEISFLADHRGA